MSYEVDRFELPDGASRLDRATLAVWKLWGVWVKPIVIVTLVMGIAMAVTGTIVAGRGGFVAPWSPTNYAPAVMPGQSLIEANGGAWLRGIGAQVVATLVACLAAWPFLRRARSHAVVVAVLAGAIVTVAHLTVSHQWAVMSPIVAAPTRYQVAAQISLWTLPVLAGVVALMAARPAPSS